MIHEVVKALSAAGLIIGIGLTLLGAVCWFTPADNTDAQALGEGVALVVLAAGLPILVLSLLGLLL